MSGHKIVVAEDERAVRESLTRALSEANHARFSVRLAPYAGTLIEVAFPATAASR